MLARSWLMDLDGVVYRGSQPVRGAAEFIRWLIETNQPFLFLTNHAARTPESFAQKLQGMGIPAEPRHILSSAMVTAMFLQRERPGKTVFLIGEEGLRHALAGAGVQIVEHQPDLVVVGLDRGIHYDLLVRASRFILGGAEFIGTNGDGSYPLEDGPAPECGALLAAIQAATGKTPLVMGKPERFMYEEGLRTLGATKEHAIMVGDRLDTDIAGAKRLGIRSVLVLSGATSRSEADASPTKPDVIVPDLAACRDSH
jgi:HAD superfamily hydrolase (TIGR01457 family)